MNSKFIKFAASSFMGFLIDYVLFCSLSLIFPDKKIYILLANIIARIISAACNYMANCLFVFEEKQRLWSTVYSGESLIYTERPTVTESSTGGLEEDYL